MNHDKPEIRSRESAVRKSHPLPRLGRRPTPKHSKQVTHPGLVLSRKVGESIVLRTDAGEQIVVTVIAIVHGKMKIGLHAPESVRILRSELLEPEED
jgi:carbon storage regulator CsrA